MYHAIVWGCTKTHEHSHHRDPIGSNVNVYTFVIFRIVTAAAAAGVYIEFAKMRNAWGALYGGTLEHIMC